MGTQVHCKSYLPGYYSMRDLNEDANSSSWPLFYGDKTITSGQYYNGYIPRTIEDVYPGYDKDQLKQRMLEHEAIFKNQVYELHRLYRIQRDMMEEIRRKELNKRQMSIEPSSSSSLLGSQKPSEDAGKWHISNFPMEKSGNLRYPVSGAEILNSPLSCTQGNSAPAGRVNGCASKDSELLEARPSKVRKKLFDLQLPADEYIDTEDEQFHDSKITEMSSSSLPNRNQKNATENCEKFFVNGGAGEKFDYQSNASASDSCTRNTTRLADLNEPVQLEDRAAPSSVDFLGNSANYGESKGLNLSAKPSSGILGLQKEIIHNCHSGNQSGTVSITSVGNKSNERGWLSGMYESGQRKNNLISLPRGFGQDKLPTPSQPAQVGVDKTRQPLGILPIGYGREEMLRERTTRSENHDRFQNNSNYNHLEPVMTSQLPNPYPFANSSDCANSWSHSALSWGKSTSSFTQKLSSFHALQSSSILSKSLPSSSQNHGSLGEKWHSNESHRLNPGVGADLPTINGFYRGSSSGSKEMLAQYPSARVDHLNCHTSGNMASTHYLNHGSGELSNGYRKPAKDMDLNVVQSKCSSNEDIEVINEKSKPEDHLAALPWLRAKPSYKSENAIFRRDANSDRLNFFQASPSKLFREGEPVKDLNETFTQKEVATPSDHELGVKKEIGETQGIKKILGVPIFERTSNFINESSSPVSTSVTLPCSLSGEKVVMEVKNRLIDINLACDEQIASEALAVEKATDTKVANIRNYIDLNSCVTEDEELLAPSVGSNSATVKIAVDINLEAPALETEDDVLAWEEDKQHKVSLHSPEPKVEETNDEVVRIAAQSIVSLSSCGHILRTEEENTCHPSEDHLAECLLWFADAVSSCADKHEGHDGKELRGNDSLLIGNYSTNEMDDFEIMTLQLQETKEEDYMPKPFVPEVHKGEESGPSSVPNRARKGQTRRGRQRKDFQRDILPGLTSLSRHEVTEDLQTFGGLMRATGHPWSSGLTRRNGTRNGGARGRRRGTVVDTVSTAVATAASPPSTQQRNNIEAGLEDQSITGWGKTTRRPRRQRCPAGNPPPATST